MPAEWEAHEATWLAWPKNRITWPGRMLKEVEGIYLQMMHALLAGEKVHLLVDDEKTGRRVLSLLETQRSVTKNLVLHRVKTVDTWIRDYGPIFVKRTPPVPPSLSKRGVRGELAFTKWTFNAWGGKYSDLARDNGVVPKLSYLKKFPSETVPMVLEGGSIDTDGRGTCLTTEQCLLNKNRNPKLSRQDIEARLKKHLGYEKIVWLKEGIEGDDTDGHVDDITRFVGPGKVLTAVEPDTSEKNHAWLDENLEILKREKSADGKRFEVHELPMPGPLLVKDCHSASGRLPASYANFYIGNAAVLLPLYAHSNDKKAFRTLKKLFPGRKIAGIQCSPLVFGLGSIHCVTQQQPA
jgi:agmatine deiminase